MWAADSCSWNGEDQASVSEPHLHFIPRIADSFCELRSLVIDDISSPKEGQCLAYFYCKQDSSEPRLSDPEQVLRTIVKQMSRPSSDAAKLSDYVVAMYERKQRDSFHQGSLETEESIDLITQLASHFSVTYILIDALDECNIQTRYKLLVGLNTIIRRSPPRLVKILVSSRDEGDIRDHLQDLPSIYIDQSRNSSDIEYYVHHKVTEAINAKTLLRGYPSSSIKQELIETVLKGAQGMQVMTSKSTFFNMMLSSFRFLWVSLQIENICSSQIILEEDLRLELSKLPASLTDLYTKIHKQKGFLPPYSQIIFQKSLKWLLCTKAPLSIEEFLVAVTTNATQDTIKVDKEDILAICSSFVVFNEEINGFRFAHFSVMEFLLSLSEYTAVAAHAFAAETCLITCSNHCMVPGSSQELEHPLQCYAVLFWAYHCQEAGERRPRSLIQAFLKDVPGDSNSPFLIWERNLRALLSSFSDWQRARDRSTLKPPCHFSKYSKDRAARRDMLSDPPDPAFAACTWGFPEVVRDRLGLKDGAKAQKSRWKYKIQSKLLKRINENNLTCFLVACKYGQNNIVQLLLEQGADINQRCHGNKHTGLTLAALGHHGSTIALLLDKGIRTDLQDSRGFAILPYAAFRAPESIVRLLIEKGVNTQIDEAIKVAARYGNNRVTQFLLDSDTRTAGIKRQTELNALCSACSGVKTSAIELLLQRGVDVNGRDTNGRSPLHHAVLSEKFNDGDAMLSLLNAGARLEIRDRDGATPLHLAVEFGNLEVLETLLDKGANPAAKTNQGQTPMDLALNGKPGYMRMVELLVLIEYESDIEAKAKLREMAQIIGVADFNTPDKFSSCLDWLVDRYRKGAPYKIDSYNIAEWLKYYYRGSEEDTMRRADCRCEMDRPPRVLMWSVERERNQRSQVNRSPFW